MEAALEEERRALFADWLGYLCDKEFGAPQQGSSGDAWTIGLANGVTVTVRFGPQGEPQVEATDASVDVSSLVDKAFENAARGDTGPGQWYRMALSCDVGIDGLALHLPRILNEHRRFEGDWAFGSDCLLTFKQANTKPAQLVIPKFDLTAVYRVASPWHGPFGQDRAAEAGTFVRSIAAFASAAPFQPLVGLFPANEGEAKAAQDALAGGLQQIHAEGLVLADALQRLVAPAGREALNRVHGAIYAYEEALSQRSEFVAAILLVSGMEALTTPDRPWRRKRLTVRFIQSISDLCSDELAEILAHENFEQAFGDMRSVRQFLDVLYDARSRPLHTGFVQHRVSALPEMGGEPGIRIMFVSKLTRAAILSFLRAPFTSLVGHPDVDVGADPSGKP